MEGKTAKNKNPGETLKLIIFEEKEIQTQNDKQGAGCSQPGPRAVEPMPGSEQHESGDGQPLSGDGQPSPGDGQPVPGDGQLVMGNDQHLPGIEQLEQGDEQLVPEVGQPVPEDGQPVQGAGQPVSMAGQPVHGDEQQLLWDGQLVLGQPLLQDGQLVLGNDHQVPRVGQPLLGDGQPVAGGGGQPALGAGQPLQGDEALLLEMTSDKLKGPEMTIKASDEKSGVRERKFEKNKMWQEFEKDSLGKLKMKKVMDKGLQLSSRRPGLKTQKLMNRTVEFEDMTVSEEILPVEDKFVGDILTMKKTVEALKTFKLVAKGRKIFEENTNPAEAELKKTVVKKEIVEEKLSLRKTPMKKGRKQEEKMTPRKFRKRSMPTSSLTPKSRKNERSIMGEGEGGKMLEGLRLGLTTVSRKIGKRNADLIKKLENCNGEDKLGLEVASPLWAGQQTFTNPKYNPLIIR